MAYITRQEQKQDGTWLTWINTEGWNTIVQETAYPMSEAQATSIRADYLSAHEYDSVPVFQATIYEYREQIRAALVFIKTSNPNANQWNTYLNGLPWDEALAVRWFLAVLARELVSRQEVSLSSYTETQVLAQLKTWIINAPARRLEKIVFGLG